MNRLFAHAGALVVVIVVAAPLAAQGGMAGMQMDQTAKIVGSGKLPKGMTARFDLPTAKLTDVDVQERGGSMRVRSGPAAIYYNPAAEAKGQYTVSASFAQTKSMGHEAYGVFVGGTNLDDSTQHYIYFEVKPCRSRGACAGEEAKTGTPLGEILINERVGNAKPLAIVANTHDDAVHTDADGTGAATNVLAIHVSRDSLRFYVNGKEVRTLPKSAFKGPTDGIYGIRVNHNSDIQVDGFGIKK
jgi:hypothetical protein